MQKKRSHNHPAKSSQPKPKKLTKTRMKARGLWMWAHYTGAKEILAQGSQEQCETALKARHLFEELTAGHIEIEKWSTRPDYNFSEEATENPELADLPPDYYID